MADAGASPDRVVLNIGIANDVHQTKEMFSGGSLAPP